jgi:hypothetical protein
VLGWEFAGEFEGDADAGNILARPRDCLSLTSGVCERSEAAAEFPKDNPESELAGAEELEVEWVGL